MKKRYLARAALGAVTAMLVAAPAALAHEGSRLVDDGVIDSGKETHWHDSAQHGSDDGHLPPTSKNVRKVGNLDLFAGAEEPGRIADVSAKGNYAYLTAFYEPECDRGGVYIADISDPASPKKVSLIPSHIGTYSGEGSQVVTLNTPSFKGDLLVYQNEWCPGTTNGVGGITLVDVTNPKQPKKLVEGFGDFTKKDGTQSGGQPQTKANQTHAAFAWTNKETGKVYVVLVDDMEELDVDILDITNPSKPVMVSETNLDQFGQTGPARPHGDSIFSHDMVVKRIGTQDVMLMSYWDGGYVTLDVTDPKNPKPLSDTDFAAADPARAERGQTITPEGNGHESEFTADNKFIFATDE